MTVKCGGERDGRLPAFAFDLAGFYEVTMKLTRKQVTTFWRLWNEAARKAGLMAETESKSEASEAARKGLLARCGFASLTQVDTSEGFDRVLRELREMFGEVSEDVIELVSEDELKRRAYVIEHHPAGSAYVFALLHSARFRSKSWDEMDRKEWINFRRTLEARFRSRLVGFLKPF